MGWWQRQPRGAGRGTSETPAHMRFDIWADYVRNLMYFVIAFEWFMTAVYHSHLLSYRILLAICYSVLFLVVGISVLVSFIGPSGVSMLFLDIFVTPLLVITSGIHFASLYVDFKKEVMG